MNGSYSQNKVQVICYLRAEKFLYMNSSDS